MPHLIVEWSTNLRGRLDVPAFLAAAHDAAMATGAFAPAALRSRAIPCHDVRVADGDPDNAFVHAVLRLRPGRSAEAKRAIGERIFAAMKDHLAPIFATSPLGLTFEMQEIDTANRFLADNLAEHLARRAAASGNQMP